MNTADHSTARLVIDMSPLLAESQPLNMFGAWWRFQSERKPPRGTEQVGVAQRRGSFGTLRLLDWTPSVDQEFASTRCHLMVLERSYPRRNAIDIAGLHCQTPDDCRQAGWSSALRPLHRPVGPRRWAAIGSGFALAMTWLAGAARADSIPPVAVGSAASLSDQSPQTQATGASAIPAVGRRGLRGRRQDNRGRRLSTARVAKVEDLESNRAVAEYLSVLDDAAFCGARFVFHGYAATPWAALRLSSVTRRNLKQHAKRKGGRSEDWFTLLDDVPCRGLPLEIETLEGPWQEIEQNDLKRRYEDLEVTLDDNGKVVKLQTRRRP
jgi:hypothetical protein